MSLIHEKLAQVNVLLQEMDLDLWLTFVRESSDGGESAMPLILGRGLTWPSALLVTRAGDRIAIVGNYDADAVRSTGAWSEVVPYVQGIRDDLSRVLQRINPRAIALNYSIDDHSADGLTHGMFLLLNGYLAEIGMADRVVSAERLLGALRAQKTPSEVALIRAAIAATDAIFAEVPRIARLGVSEAEIARQMRAAAERGGMSTSWDATQCPIVNCGPESKVGHGVPSETLRVRPGQVLHIDFGVRRDDYCSDIQRVWYVPEQGETRAPDGLVKAFDAVTRAIQAAFEALKPGVEGWQIDAAARGSLLASGFQEYMHATGHHVGRAAHDGGGVLGPRWERYGRAPFARVAPGHVYTLELGVENADGRGYVGVEEMALVTPQGAEWLSTPQRSIPLLTP